MKAQFQLWITLLVVSFSPHLHAQQQVASGVSHSTPAQGLERSSGKAARLKVSVSMTVKVDGKAAGTMTLPPGTVVTIAERKDHQVHIRWKNLDNWVDLAVLELTEQLESSKPAATTVSAAPAPEAKGGTTFTGGSTLADWDFSKARKSKDSITVPNEPDLFGGSLVGEGPDWANVVVDEKAPNGRAVRFDGTANQKLSSKASIDIEKGAEVQIEIDLNPSEANRSTVRILRFANSFELRLLSESRTLQFLVWNEANKYSKVDTQLTFDAWNNVKAAYKEGLLEITVNGETVRKNLPSDIIMRAGSAKALVTHSFENQAFSGSIGKIRVTTRSAASPALPAAEAGPAPPASQSFTDQEAGAPPPALAEPSVARSTHSGLGDLSEEVMIWDFSKARASASKISVSGTKGLEASTKGAKLKDWASLEDDRSAPGGRSLRLYGGTEQALGSLDEFNWAEGQPIRIEMGMNPSSSMDGPVPVLRCAVFAVDYMADRRSVSFIVYHKNGYTIATAPAAPDTWHNIVAECRDGALELSVDGQTTRTELPAGVVMKAGEGRSFFAFPRNGKSFQGSISRVGFFTKGAESKAERNRQEPSGSAILGPPSSQGSTPGVPRELVGPWKTGTHATAHTYDFKSSGEVIRSFPIWSGSRSQSVDDAEIELQEWQAFQKDGKIVVCPKRPYATYKEWFEIPIPFDPLKPSALFYRVTEGGLTETTFVLTKPATSSAGMTSSGNQDSSSPTGKEQSHNSASGAVQRSQSQRDAVATSLHTLLPITVSGQVLEVTRLGKGPIGVIFFGHSGSQEMVATLLKDEKWFGDLLPDQCSFFLWSYPDAPPFDKVNETIKTYRGGDQSVRLPLPGIAESVVSQIRKATGIEKFLIVGNSLGAGLVLWDYPKLVNDPALSFLLISPTEAFLPEVGGIPTLERTMLLAAKGWMNQDGQMRTDSFLKGEEAWDWVAQYRDDEVGDLITSSVPDAPVQEKTLPNGNVTRVRMLPRQDFKMGHKTIGGDINAELLGKLIRVNLGLSPKESLAEPPKQTE